MEKKPFEFPTFAQWASESYRRMADKDLRSPTPGMGQLEENMADHFFKGWKRFYALDFLTALMEWVNEGQVESSKTEPPPYAFIEYGSYSGVKKWVHYPSSVMAPEGNLFYFADGYDANEFLKYKGCGTDTVSQMNILYNIK